MSEGVKKGGSGNGGSVSLLSIAFLRSFGLVCSLLCSRQIKK